MKTVGIIGGFGPETTNKFFKSLIMSWQKKNPNQRPEILLWNAPVDNKIEQKFIFTGNNAEKFLPLLKDGAQKLEKASAHFLVLPCNSLHIFIKNIKGQVKIPILSIVDETVKILKKNRVRKVGLLGTTPTVKSKLFSREKITILTPSKENQIVLNKIIHNLVINQRSEMDSIDFANIIGNLKTAGAKNILLACTDLQLLKPNIKGIKFFDTFEILVQATVEKMLEE